MGESENAVERAVINMLYAKAELVSPTDPQAPSRAIDLISKALDELMPQAAHFGAMKVLHAA